MNRLVLLRPAAEADPAAVAHALQQLAQDPERPRLYYRDFRRIILRRFPYKIFYQVIGSRIVIFRVLHAKQDHNQRLD